MRTRMTALILVAGLAMSGVADAATKHKPKPKPPPCHIITDPGNDSGPVSGKAGAPAYDASLDIVSADIATNATMITAVIRVKQLTQSDSTWPLGREWSFDYTTSTGHQDGFIAYDGPSGQTSSIGHLTMDYAHGEVRISAKLSDLPYALPKGTTLSVLQAYTKAVGQLPANAATGPHGALDMPGVSAEDSAIAPTTSKYSVGAPTCVKVGT